MSKIAAIMIALTAALTGNGNISKISELKTTVNYVDEYSITVNKSTNCVTVYQKTDKGNFTPIKAMICSVGKNKGDTPSGSFKTQAKYTWRPLFGNVYGQYATRINGHILFHSVYYKTTNPATLKTAEYNNLGTSASAGCVRLTAADAKWIYDNCKIGTKVDIIESGADPLERPAAIKLGENAPHPNWDPTDPNPNNPWQKEGIKFKLGTGNKRIKISDNISSKQLDELLKKDVIAYDIANNPIPFDFVCNVNTAEAGTYEVKYYAYDCLNNYGEAYANVIVSNE